MEDMEEKDLQVGEIVTIDGEKYYIVVDVNHKKKKYKIQNKFPDNWDEFLQLQSLIMEGKEDA